MATFKQQDIGPVSFRFWSKTQPGNDGCILWCGGLDSDGYGKFSYKHKNYRAHRFAYLLVFGEDPGCLQVLHRCDNPACVNPAHLCLGTQSDNVIDMYRKGRYAKAKLNARRVRAIKKELSKGRTNVDIACYNLPDKVWLHMETRLINQDCVDYLDQTEDHFDMLLADPPDNLGLDYIHYRDERDYYDQWLKEVVNLAAKVAPCCWWSFNAKWTFLMGDIFSDFLRQNPDWEGKACVQHFTFGQHNKHDLANCHRPLWRLKHKDAPLYPDAVRVPSWRQLNNDKRADPRGRVPGDVFDFPRVTGNAKQRQLWHPTQLHEDLVERCITLCTKEGDSVLDPFMGSGTTFRVCKRINRDCTGVELDSYYCKKLATLHHLTQRGTFYWDAQHENQETATTAETVG